MRHLLVNVFKADQQAIVVVLHWIQVRCITYVNIATVQKQWRKLLGLLQVVNSLYLAAHSDSDALQPDVVNVVRLSN